MADPITTLREQADNAARGEGGSDWGTRRYGVRHAVTLPAHVTSWCGTRMPCALADISSDGAALTISARAAAAIWHELEPGTDATLEFAAPGGAAVTAPVAIMRRTQGTVGVRFSAPDGALRAALRALAEAAVSARVADFERSARPLDPARRALLVACRRQFGVHLPTMIHSVRHGLITALRDMSRGASGLAAHGPQAEAGRLEACAQTLARDIEVTMVQGFAEVSDLDQTQELTVMMVRAADSGRPIGSAGDPGRPASRSGEAYLADLCRAAERRYGTTFMSIDRDLAAVVGHRIDPRHNPLPPAAVCRIFWRAVTEHVDSPRVEKLLYEIMTTRVLPLLGDFYAALGTLLAAAPPRDADA